MIPEFRFRRFSTIIVILTSLLPVSCGHMGNPTPVNTYPDKTRSSLIDFYQGPLNHLSAVRAGQCPMHPSCSDYARKSLETFGLLKGWMMAFDRLMRCGRDETRTAPRVFVDGSWKYHDPVIPLDN